MNEKVRTMSFRARLQTSLLLIHDRFGCLYGVSILWSILLGVLSYVIGRLPLWFFIKLVHLLMSEVPSGTPVFWSL